MNATRELGVALVNREGENVRYSLTDEFSHYCGDVVMRGDVIISTEDKYGSQITTTNPLFNLMMEGVNKYRVWAAKHNM